MGVSTLSSLQNVDLILHLLREFEDENVTHYRAIVDPLKDLSIVNKEILYYVRKQCVHFMPTDSPYVYSTFLNYLLQGPGLNRSCADRFRNNQTPRVWRRLSDVSNEHITEGNTYHVRDPSGFRLVATITRRNRTHSSIYNSHCACH